MSDTIKVGDVVRLKSGGPAMSVGKIDVEVGRSRATCAWFPTNTLTGDYGMVETALFNIETLIHLHYDDDDAIDTAAAAPSYYDDNDNVGTMSPQEATHFLSELRKNFE